MDDRGGLVVRSEIGTQPGRFFDPVSHVLQQVYVRGDISLRQFEHALDGLLHASGSDDVARIVASLPLGVAMTPRERRLREPLRLSAGMSALTIDGRWQVAQQTDLSAGMAKLSVDLTHAELDALEIDLRVSAGMSKVELVVPEHMHVALVRVTGRVVFEFDRGDWIPGLPVLNMTADAGMGRITLRRPSAVVATRRKRGSLFRTRS